MATNLYSTSSVICNAWSKRLSEIAFFLLVIGISMLSERKQKILKYALENSIPADNPAVKNGTLIRYGTMGKVLLLASRIIMVLALLMILVLFWFQPLKLIPSVKNLLPDEIDNWYMFIGAILVTLGSALIESHLTFGSSK